MSVPSRSTVRTLLQSLQASTTITEAATGATITTAAGALTATLQRVSVCNQLLELVRSGQATATGIAAEDGIAVIVRSMSAHMRDDRFG